MKTHIFSMSSFSMLLLLFTFTLRTSLSANDSPTIDLDALEQISLDNVTLLEEILTIEGTTAYAIAFSPNRELFAYSLNDQLNVWNLFEQEFIFQEASQPYLISFDPYSQRLATVEHDVVSLWDIENSFDKVELHTGERADYTDHVSATDIRFSEDGSEIITAFTGGGGIVRWQISGERIDRIDYGYGPEIPTVVGSDLDMYGQTNIITLSDFPHNEVQIRRVYPNETLSSLSFSNLLSVEQYSLRVLAVAATGEIAVNVSDPYDISYGSIAIANFDGVVLNFVEHNMGFVTTGVFSNGQQILALGTRTGEIYLWNVANGGEIRVLEAHTDSITDLAFSPRDEVLVSSSGDGTIRFWGIPS
jgi:WD40 repeat protein